VILVKKKDKSYRFCVDYRYLNAITAKGQYPVPIIDEFFDELRGASWFSSLDLCSGFHQIPMHPKDCFKTAFQTHNGHYEFRVMSFGLTGAPHSFQKAMNSTLAPLLRKCALVFFDDILVYSSSLQEHVNHLSQVLQLLRQDQWRVKRSKCSFVVREIAYLGYIISSAGVATCPDKVKAVADWHVPSNAKELRSFLGLAGYYRKFVHHLGIISRPLTDLLKRIICLFGLLIRKQHFRLLSKHWFRLQFLLYQISPIPFLLRQMHLKLEWVLCLCREDTQLLL
jgi:hypothetical protein